MTETSFFKNIYLIKIIIIIIRFKLNNKNCYSVSYCYGMNMKNIMFSKTCKTDSYKGKPYFLQFGDFLSPKYHWKNIATLSVLV